MLTNLDLFVQATKRNSIMMLLTLLALALLASACDATQLRSSSSQGQQRRELFLCLLGLCEDDPSAQNRDYTGCENRTDGFFGGRPLIGECGYITEFVDQWIEPEDTDGDGEFDRIIFNNVLEGRVNADGSVSSRVPPSWLQIFPRDSLMWEIFGPEGTFDESVIDRAIGSIFGEESTFGRIVVAPFALDWEPTFTNATCPVNTVGVPAAASTPTCMTSRRSDGVYVCRTLYNPYTAEADSRTICMGPNEQLLASNDVCGCCGGICPEVVVEEECQCRCNLNGINDGLSITSNGFGESCVTKENAVATIGQFDVACSNACPQAQPGVINPSTSIAALSVKQP